MKDNFKLDYLLAIKDKQLKQRVFTLFCLNHVAFNVAFDVAFAGNTFDKQFKCS
jgi:hypothetical protein